MKRWKESGSAPTGFAIVPADGGWALMVLAGCYVCGAVVTFPTITFAVTMNDVMATFQINKATVSWALATLNATAGILGPLSAVAAKTLSNRTCVITGAIIYATALVLSSFATNIVHLVVTFGFIGGIGGSLIYVPLMDVLSSYFESYFGVATGIYLSSFSMAKLSLIPLADHFTSLYGWRGCLLMMAALTLHACVGAALFQPAKWHWRLTPIEPSQLDVAIVNGVDGHQKAEETAADGFMIKLRKAMDPSLLKDPAFYTFSLTYCVIISVTMFASGYLFSLGVSTGLTSRNAAWFASVNSIGELFGRMSAMAIIKVFHWPIVPSFIVATAASALTFIGLTLMTSTVTLFVMVGVSGVVFGSSVGMCQSLITDTVGVAKLMPTMGFTVFIQGIFILGFGPLSGWLIDVTDSYGSCFMLYGCLLAAVSLKWMAIWLYRRHHT